MFNYRLTDVIEYYWFVMMFTFFGRLYYMAQVVGVDPADTWKLLCLLTTSEVVWIVCASIIIGAITMPFVSILFILLEELARANYIKKHGK